jgi:hypothetical protein
MPVHENEDFEAYIYTFDVEEELPLFLNSVLDRAENMISAGSANINEIQTCLVVVD